MVPLMSTAPAACHQSGADRTPPARRSHVRMDGRLTECTRKVTPQSSPPAGSRWRWPRKPRPTHGQGTRPCGHRPRGDRSPMRVADASKSAATRVHAAEGILQGLRRIWQGFERPILQPVMAICSTWTAEQPPQHMGMAKLGPDPLTAKSRLFLPYALSAPEGQAGLFSLF